VFYSGVDDAMDAFRHAKPNSNNSTSTHAFFFFFLFFFFNRGLFLSHYDLLMIMNWKFQIISNHF